MKLGLQAEIQQNSKCLFLNSNQVQKESKEVSSFPFGRLFSRCFSSISEVTSEPLCYRSQDKEVPSTEKLVQFCQEVSDCILLIQRKQSCCLLQSSPLVQTFSWEKMGNLDFQIFCSVCLRCTRQCSEVHLSNAAMGILVTGVGSSTISPLNLFQNATVGRSL